jgi:hypothetical protein
MFYFPSLFTVFDQPELHDDELWSGKEEVIEFGPQTGPFLILTV